MENPGNPVWFGALKVTNRTPALSALIPADTVVYVAPVRLLAWVAMFTLLNVAVPASKVNDPVAAAPSANLTPARNHCSGAEAPSMAVTDPAVMERIVPEGTVHQNLNNLPLRQSKWPYPHCPEVQAKRVVTSLAALLGIPPAK
jgi:hypothetical protein